MLIVDQGLNKKCFQYLLYLEVAMPHMIQASVTTPVSTSKSFAPCQAIPQLLYDFFKEIVGFFASVFLVWGFSAFTLPAVTAGGLA